MQHENFSIDSQRRICAQFCEIRGWKIINEYVDDGVQHITRGIAAYKLP